jgi:hypothetical protein
MDRSKEVGKLMRTVFSAVIFLSGWAGSLESEASCRKGMVYEPGYEHPIWTSQFSMIANGVFPDPSPMIVHLKWCEVRDTTPVAGYNLYYSKTAGNYTADQRESLDFAVDSDPILRRNPGMSLALNYGTRYHFVVRTLSSAAVESPNSEEISFLTYKIVEPRKVCIWNSQLQSEDEFLAFEYDESDQGFAVQLETLRSLATQEWETSEPQILKALPRDEGILRKTVVIPLETVGGKLQGYRLSARVAINPGVDQGCPE